jgi:hypothetical protein
MYLVTPPPSANHSHRWLFFYSDPRSQGCPYPVTAGVTFEDCAPRFQDGMSGLAVQSVLARKARTPSAFRVFANPMEVPTDWEVVEGEAEVWASWQRES